MDFQGHPAYVLTQVCVVVWHCFWRGTLACGCCSNVSTWSSRDTGIRAHPGACYSLVFL
jgi:hypothetical protein